MQFNSIITLKTLLYSKLFIVRFLKISENFTLYAVENVTELAIKK